MSLGTITIGTERLKLRKLTFEDVQAVYTNLKSDERITDNMIKAAHRKLDETQELLEEIIIQYDNPYFCYWGIELTEDKELIGLIDLYDFNLEESRCEVGYSLGYNWWNKGYGTEALMAVIDFAFNSLKMKEVSAAHNLDNPASGRVMEKAGMKMEHIVKKMITNAKGQVKDCAIYIIKSNA